MAANSNNFTSVGKILKNFSPLKDKYISREFQKYGYDLAQALGDLKNCSLYIKLAKEEPRPVLEKIKYEVLESGRGNLGRLFMWKIGQYRWRKKLLTQRLPRSFFAVSPVKAAQALLGQVLVSVDKYETLRAGLIIETEAYGGACDLASHARFGKKGRAKAMWARPGTAYVYLIYGQHVMFNVVAHKKDQAGAVLIRSLKPLVGGGAKNKVDTRGPAKLTSFLKIDLQSQGVDLITSSSLWLAKGEEIEKEKIAAGPRVGVAYADSWALKPWRFWIKHSRYVSRA